jgi:inner membrane protein COX18
MQDANHVPSDCQSMPRTNAQLVATRRAADPVPRATTPPHLRGPPSTMSLPTTTRHQLLRPLLHHHHHHHHHHHQPIRALNAALHPHRHFSSTPRRPTTLLDVTTSAFEALHTTSGLSWSTLIPLTALSVRLCILPLTLYAREKTSTIIRLLPLQSAATAQLAKKLAKSAGTATKWERQLRKEATAHRRLLWKRWGVQYWKLFVPFVQLPVWLVASATIRALLPPPPPPQDGAAVGKGVDWLMDAFGGLERTHTAQGLVSEGLAFCADLTMADPSHALPVVLWSALIANLAFHHFTNPPEKVTQKAIAGTLYLLSFWMAYVGWHAPAALVLYWSASACSALAFNLALHVLKPLPERVKKCQGGALEDARKVLTGQAVVLGNKVIT